MKYRIVRNFKRSEKDLQYAKELARFGTANVCESQNNTGILSPEIVPRQRGKSVAGTAVTIDCYDADNLMVHAAVELCQEGDFMIMTSKTPNKHGYFGELMGRASKYRGVVGFVTDCGVRDTAQLNELDFPLWSRWVAITGTSKNRPGNINVPIVCGGVQVNPGDFIVADDDAVVVVARENVEEVIRKSREREEREVGLRERISRGEVSLDFSNIRGNIEKAGIEYVDE